MSKNPITDRKVNFFPLRVQNEIIHGLAEIAREETQRSGGKELVKACAVARRFILHGIREHRKAKAWEKWQRDAKTTVRGQDTPLAM